MPLTWGHITNNESAEEIRLRLNAFLDELAEFVNDPDEADNQSRWQPEGANNIEPKNNKGVKCDTLTTDELQVTGTMEVSMAATLNNDLNIPGIGTGVVQQVYVLPGGKLIGEHQKPVGYTLTVNIDIYQGQHVSGYGFLRKPHSQEPYKGADIVDNTLIFNGVEDGNYILHVMIQGYIDPMQMVVIDGADKTTNVTPVPVNPIFPGMDVETGTTRLIQSNKSVIVASPEEEENVNFSLPEASEVVNQEVVIRKGNHDGDALTINVSGDDKIYLNNAQADGITTDDIGSWVMLKSDGKDWHVIMNSDNWETIV